MEPGTVVPPSCFDAAAGAGAWAARPVRRDAGLVPVLPNAEAQPCGAAGSAAAAAQLWTRNVRLAPTAAAALGPYSQVRRRDEALSWSATPGVLRVQAGD